MFSGSLISKSFLPMFLITFSTGSGRQRELTYLPPLGLYFTLQAGHNRIDPEFALPHLHAVHQAVDCIYSSLAKMNGTYSWALSPTLGT